MKLLRRLDPTRSDGPKEKAVPTTKEASAKSDGRAPFCTLVISIQKGARPSDLARAQYKTTYSSVKSSGTGLHTPSVIKKRATRTTWKLRAVPNPKQDYLTRATK